jgi:hypothetical protein
LPNKVSGSYLEKEQGEEGWTRMPPHPCKWEFINKIGIESFTLNIYEGAEERNKGTNRKWILSTEM